MGSLKLGSPDFLLFFNVMSVEVLNEMSPLLVGGLGDGVSWLSNDLNDLLDAVHFCVRQAYQRYLPDENGSKSHSSRLKHFPLH